MNTELGQLETPVLIALDWGTSSLRAYAMGADGAVLATRRSEHGVMHLPSGPDIPSPAAAFEQALQLLCGDWLAGHPQAPLIACGMVGSAQGWREAPYRPLPSREADLAGAVTRDRTPRWPAPARGAGPAAGRRVAQCDARRRDPDHGRAAKLERRGPLAVAAADRPAGHAHQVGLGRTWRRHPLRDLHDRRGVRRAHPTHHPGPHHGARRRTRRTGLRAWPARGASHRWARWACCRPSSACAPWGSPASSPAAPSPTTCPGC